MTASIDRIKSTISSRGGLARPNNFLVELPSLPGFGRANETLNMLCRQTTLPFKQIMSVPRRIGMESEEIAYGYAVENITMSFLMTNDYYARKYFDRWKDLIINEDQQIVNYKNNYEKRIVLHQLRNSIPSTAFDISIGQIPLGLPITNIISSIAARSGVNISTTAYSVELKNAFPKNIGEIQFSNDENVLSEMAVTIAYTNWKRVTSSQITFKL
tara:strand:+ start:508 stop:1152 length:645 start_codon:yes stop_codon:yes gene_type:complete